jgi:hypothetical protein
MSMDTTAAEAEMVKLMEGDPQTALSMITSMFVGMLTGYMRARGLDDTGEMTVKTLDCGQERNITLHAVEPREWGQSPRLKTSGYVQVEEPPKPVGLVWDEEQAAPEDAPSQGL